MTLLVPTSASPYHLMQPYNFYHQQDLTAAPNRELSHCHFAVLLLDVYQTMLCVTNHSDNVLEHCNSLRASEADHEQLQVEQPQRGEQVA